VTDVIPLPGGEVEITRPRDAESLLCEQEFDRDEFLPYWAELWSSAVALAHELSLRSLRGKRTLELGCGLGLPSIAAARAGGRVVASDWSADAVLATRANAEQNGVALDAIECAWASPEPLVERAPWDLVIASDVLYERRNADQLLALLPRLVDARGLVLIADPGRAAAEHFVERAREQDWIVATRGSPRAGRVSIHRLRSAAEA